MIASLAWILLATSASAPIDSVAAALAAGRFQDADRLAQATLQAAELDPGPDSVRVAEALESLLRVDVRQSRTGADGLARARRVVAIRERAHGPDDPRLAVALNSLAGMLWSNAQYDEARSIAERALQLLQDAGTDADAERARSLTVLANVEMSAGDPDLAIERWKELHALRVQTEGAESSEAAQALHSLGIAYRNAGESIQALSTHRRALEIRERVLGSDHPDVAWTLLNLANVYFDLGDFEESAQLNRRALDIRERTLGPDHVQVALSLMNLANAIERSGRPAQAVPLHERALAIYERQYGPWHRRVAQSLNNLALARMELGELDAARPLFERSIAIRDSLLGPESEEAARTRLRLGNLYLRAGEPENAEPVLRAAVAAQTKHLGPNHPLAQDAPIALAEALLRLRRPSEALELSLAAERTTIEHLRLTAQGLDEAQALIYSRTRSSGLDVALTLAAAAPRDTALVARVWDALVRSRSVVLDEMVSRRHWAMASTDTSTSRLRSRVVDARDQLARLALRAPDADSTASKAFVAALREKRSAEQAFAEHSLRFRGELASAGAGLAECAAALPTGAALVTFAKYSDLSQSSRGDSTAAWIAFVLGSGAGGPRAVPLGDSAPIESALQAWLAAMREPPDPLRRARDETTCTSRGQAVRALVWDPVAALLADSEPIGIAPEGLLQIVPLSALPDGAGRPLAESGPLIHLLTTERDLVARSPVPGAPEISAGTRSEGRGLLAMGGPTFDLHPAVASMPLESRDPCAFLDGPFTPLPGAAHEVVEIAKTWDGAVAARGTPELDRARVLTGPAATELALREGAPGRRALHVASHGFFVPERCSPPDHEIRAGLLSSPLLRGGIALAGANERAGPTEGDGILLAEEVAGLDLQSLEWVVLSACETALGELDLNEGVMGLRRAFRAAGARALVMSLWRVDDEATREWMRVLYERRFVDGLEPAAASRAATRDMLRARRAEGRSTHPYYWASFVVEGGW